MRPCVRSSAALQRYKRAGLPVTFKHNSGGMRVRRAAFLLASRRLRRNGSLAAAHNMSLRPAPIRDAQPVTAAQ